MRLAILEYLKEGERCVCEIVEHLGAGQPNISHHLALMVNAGVLANRKDGLKVFYSVRTPCLWNFLSCVDGILRERVESASALLKGGVS